MIIIMPRQDDVSLGTLPELILCLISDYLHLPSMGSFYSALPHRFNSTSHMMPTSGVPLNVNTDKDKEHEKRCLIKYELDEMMDCDRTIVNNALGGDRVEYDGQQDREEFDNLLAPRSSLPPPRRECGQTLACDLLSKTLMDNLERVLQRQLIPQDRALYDKLPCESTGGGILSSFSALCRSLPPNSVCISGGSMVQAILGEGKGWQHSDVDIFCTMESAPLVRQFLVGQLDKTLVTVSSGYSSSAMSLTDDIIHHVEKYGNTPKNGGKVFHREETISHPPSRIGFHYSREYATRKHELPFTTAKGQRASVELDGRLLNGLDIPVEARLLNGLDASGRPFVNVDLVVLDSCVGVVNAIHETFDLEICMSVFDGVSFCTPYWTDTLQKRSKLTGRFENKLALLYMKHLHNESKRSFGCVILDLIGKMVELPEDLELYMKGTRRYTPEVGFITDTFDWSLKMELWSSLENDFNSKNIFSEYFDKKEIRTRLMQWASAHVVGNDYYSAIDDVCHVVFVIRKCLIIASLYRVIEDPSYSLLKERTISLVEVVDHIVDLLNLDGSSLNVIGGAAVGRLSPIVGDVHVGVEAFIGLYDDDQWGRTENAWLGATGSSKADFLRKMLLWITKQTYSDVSGRTQYTHKDSVSAELFQGKASAMLSRDMCTRREGQMGSWNLEVYDNEMEPFTCHYLLVKRINRWLKYIGRGIDVGLEAVSIEQEWASLSRPVELDLEGGDGEAWFGRGDQDYFFDPSSNM